MTEPILADYPALVSAVMSIGEKLELHNDQRQWMNKEQAQAYVNLGRMAFQTLVDKGIIKPHDLAPFGLARMERYNRDELDEAMKSI
ncbi:hypothetical protein FKV75_02630 [Weissella paramesenteroides]|jgi:hypothetical protein|uniref:hypothetical protein n=1 Tax=Weissella paramesenteroides TaxID=1249 RepID=UPI00123B6403|nr:hypothetical protein [Weissella paramesenteroides]KAA8439187.1 hypothetical protein FKV81_08885 [Weissella paramesenteroides]KAA8440106.1 hypothetical protein FKV77_08570 [Weissella paramesenteroides]KAA8443984.1 hypothetical protein FKV75_02630 [Weissella paramesenteroides]KAA8445071.1 hypothetical protein FKV72_07945 [Weissella paramesenteroides]KAA8446465.1 hypothetical protein FKV76_06240 [Weissella paramesenteroides]